MYFRNTQILFTVKPSFRIYFSYLLQKGATVENGKRFDEAILLRMQKGTTQRLREASSKYGQSVSEYVRQLIRKALERNGSDMR